MGCHAGRSAGHQQRQLVSVMSDKYRETDWSGWNNWCDSRVDARRSFDRAVPIGLVAELKAMIEDQDEQLKVQAENIRSPELKLADLGGANDVRSAEDRHTSVKLAEHQIAIAELRHCATGQMPNKAKVIDLPDVLQRRGLN
jgi:hypothetical protein